MKVVINGCFGGFGLSPAAHSAYLARKGETAHFYEEDRATSGRPFGERDYVRVDSPVDEPFGAACVVEDFGPLATGEQIWKSGAYRYDRDIDRDDPDLVAVVEELGAAASSWAAQLRVVEVPDDATWEIDEYDGNEHVAEVHRTWS